MMGQKLIQRVGRRDQGCHRRFRLTASTTCLLPGAGDGARISGQHSGAHSADVDSQFQGGGGHHRTYLTIAQPLFNLTALAG
jgi:hypothetical protein